MADNDPSRPSPSTGDSSALGATTEPIGSERRAKHLSPHRILYGLFAGVVLGLLMRWLMAYDAERFEPIGKWLAINVGDFLGRIFLRLILMVVVPLVFSSLILGIAGIGDPRRLGRLGLRTFGLTLVLSLISVMVGVGLTNAIRPGASLTKEAQAKLLAEQEADAKKQVNNASRSKDIRGTLLSIIPSNPLQEMVGALDGSSPDNGILSVMFFATMVGLAVSMAPQTCQPLVNVMESVFDVCMRIIGWAMMLAPIGVAGLMFRLTVEVGVPILQSLAWYVATVLIGLLIQLLVVYSVTVMWLGGMSPRTFFTRIQNAMVTAFSTSSSNATLPTAMRTAEQELGIKPEVSRFVLTVGSTANQNGTALYEGVTVLFIAQVFGKDLSLVEQINVVLLSILAGVGTAGVPGGSLPAVVLVLQTIRVPPEGIAIILGVDRLLDMCRTTLNVVGDLVVAKCVDRGERG
jgi:dicarboxylate/amino acid:cation (Na+ or H+) symporter, DAACS family